MISTQGCKEKTDTFNPNPKEWSAFRSTDYGYTRMQVVNSTHLYLEQVSDDQVSYGKSGGVLLKANDAPAQIALRSVSVWKGY